MATAMALWGSQASNEMEQKMSKRFKDFLFLFGVATAHELCHTFSTYLSKYYSPDNFTPPSITHLNYRGAYPGDTSSSITNLSGPDRDADIETGESGRWYENRLFGGSVEFYRDPDDDDGQVRFALLQLANINV